MPTILITRAALEQGNAGVDPQFLVHYRAKGAAMLDAAPDTIFRLLRIAIIFFALIVPLIRLLQQRKKPTQPIRPKAPSVGEALREAMRQSAEQARARRGGFSEPAREAGALRMSEPIKFPPTIEPESSFLPSLLLIALLVCLGVMAYRYFAG
jgi:hypothetical protein